MVMKKRKSEFFQGIQGLRNEGIEMDLTKEQIKEIYKCSQYSKYFINKYCYIVTLDEGKQLFNTRFYQDDMLQIMEKNTRAIFKLPRQSGKSAIVAAFLVWEIIFNDFHSCSILANKEKSAKNILKKVKLLYKTLPYWLQQGITGWSKLSIELENGSYIEASATSASGTRSDSINTLVIDECAWIPKNIWDEFYSSIYPTVSSSKKSKIIMISTPRGMNHFYKFWNDAENNKNIFAYYEIGYMDVPAYAEPGFKERTIAELGLQKWTQEYECVIPSTPIFTKDGCKQIKDIQIGDYVLTHNGRFRKVIAHRKKWIKEQLNEITNSYNKKSPLNITSNHPIYGHDFNKFLDKNISFQNAFNNYENKLSFKSIDEIGNNRFYNVMMPDVSNILSGKINQIDLYDKKYQLNKDNSKIRYDLMAGKCSKYIEKVKENRNRETGFLNRYIPLNFDIGYIIGLFLAEGMNVKNGITISLNSDEDKISNKFNSFLEEYFGFINPKLETRDYSNGVVWHYHNKIIKDFISKFVIDEKNCQKWLKDIVYETNKDFIKGIITGHYEGDGLHKNGYKIWSSTVSEKLFYQLRLFYSIFEFYPAQNKMEFDEYQTRYGLELSNANCSINELFEKTHIDLLKDNSRIGIIDKNIVSKQFKVKKYDYEGYVHNLEVEEDNSYIANNIVVHNCQFLGSSGTLISSYHLQNTLVMNDPKDIRFDDHFRIFEMPVRDEKEPKNNHQYVMICDFGEGVGLDYSTIQVMDVTGGVPWKEVAVYEDNVIAPSEMPYVMDRIGQFYNHALIIGETNSIGIGILDDLNYDLEYENLFYGDNDHFGIKMTKASKRSGNMRLKQNIEDGNLLIQDSGTISQFSTYVKQRDSYAAEEETDHDDLVTPLVLFSYFMSNRDWTENWLDQARLMNTDKISKIEEDLLPAGYIDNGIEVTSFEEFESEGIFSSGLF